MVYILGVEEVGHTGRVLGTAWDEYRKPLLLPHRPFPSIPIILKRRPQLGRPSRRLQINNTFLRFYLIKGSLIRDADAYARNFLLNYLVFFSD